MMVYHHLRLCLQVPDLEEHEAAAVVVELAERRDCGRKAVICT